MAPARHLSLLERKAIAPRLMLIESYLPVELRLHAGGAGADLVRLETRLRLDTNRESVASASGDHQALDAFAAALADRVRREALDRLSGRREPLFHSVLDSFAAVARGVSCATCAGGEVCRGLPRDDDLVERGGRCLAPLKELFDVAAQAAIRYYARFAPGTPSPVFRFHTRSTAGRPHDIDGMDAISIGGRARRRRDRGDVHCDVTLDVLVDGFDRGSYLAVLYVLLHECLIHGFEGLTDPALPSDYFAEGWMDSVAVQVLQEMVDGVAPVEDLRGRLRAPPEHVRVGRGLSQARAAYATGRKYAVYAAIGHAAANRMRDLLHRLTGDADAARTAFLRLSLGLNAMGASVEERRAFCLALAEPAGTRLGHRAEAEIARKVGGFLRGTIDASRLFHDVASF